MNKTNNFLDLKSFKIYFIIAGILISLNVLYASGIGIGLPVYFGTIDYDQYESDVNNLGINFEYDTNVSENRIFNYRLSIGYENFSHKFHDYFRDDYSGEIRKQFGTHKGFRIVADHTLLPVIIPYVQD